ncbi:hypothetical protein CHUAL_011860 [Chamberlinius hualienensis]
MAARRISKSAIDWVAFADKVPADQKHFYQAFKTRADLYLRRVLAQPENPPAIDWTSYKKSLSPAFVEQFEKQYAALKVPFPTENVTPQVDEQEREANKRTASFISASKERVSTLGKELERWNSMIPFEEMTLEELSEAIPGSVFDRNKPRMWPRGIEEKIAHNIAHGGHH